MTVAAITPISVNETAITWPTTGATVGNPAGGHTFKNLGNMIAVVTNTNSGSTAHTITEVTPGEVGGNAIEDNVRSIPANTTKAFKIGSRSVYGADVVLIPEDAELHISVLALAD